MLVFLRFAEGGICLPDTWAAGVARSLDNPALVVLFSVQCCHDATATRHFLLKLYNNQRESRIMELLVHKNSSGVQCKSCPCSLKAVRAAGEF